MTKKIKIFLASLFVVMVLTIIAFGSLTKSSCTNNIIKENLSPGGGYKAVYYVQNCGAISDFYTYIDLQDIGKKSKPVNIFSEKGSHENYSLKWYNDNKLEVVYDGSEGDMYTSVIKSWSDVTINYVKQ